MMNAVEDDPAEIGIEERCTKCGGLSVWELLSDPDSTLPNRIVGSRCLNCGRIEFPINQIRPHGVGIYHGRVGRSRR